MFGTKENVFLENKLISNLFFSCLIGECKYFLVYDWSMKNIFQKISFIFNKRKLYRKIVSHIKIHPDNRCST